VSADCVEPIRRIHQPLEETPQWDIRREKRLLRRAIAASNGSHRIRLQRELAALEDYEREKRQKLNDLVVNA
jgi:Ser/Thr protein kinase RdoA (MazF antagonist)